jgi:FtsZ-binding cell division protein ZapB
MGTTIAMSIFAGLFVCAAFVCSKLHDKLLKERTTVKNLQNEINELVEKQEWLRDVIEEATLDNRKLSQKNDALQKDYDKLLCDYHTLEQEIEQYYDSKKEK